MFGGTRPEVLLRNVTPTELDLSRCSALSLKDRQDAKCDVARDRLSVTTCELGSMPI
jgi:hypothetical protein